MGVRAITRWWRTRQGVELFDLSTRWPLYGMSSAEPLVAALVVGGQPSGSPVAAGAVLLTATVHTVACVALLRRALAHRLGGAGPGRRLVAAALLLTLCGVVVSVVALPGAADPLVEDGYPVGFALGTMFACGLTLAVTPRVRLRSLALGVAVPAAATGVAQWLGDAGSQVSWPVSYLFLVVPLVLTYRSSTWVLGVVWQIDRARSVAARLAVAEERLRVARDLHDVLGRNLTLISANSELAARLVARDPDSAAERMLHVRQIAQDSMREARDVVGGARTAELEAELAGARSVLRSAGIDTRVIGDGARLPPAAQTALGWVVREATTNVLRHAEPTQVRIELDVTEHDVAGRDVAGLGAAAGSQRVARLRIENDGVRDPRAGAGPGPVGDPGGRPGDGHGTGLAGLRERLDAVGGTLVAEHHGAGRFSVEARLPVGDHAPHAPAGSPS